MKKLRIATFNVNSVRSRMPVLERWLPASGVDLLCLQETKVVDAEFPAAAFEAMGYTPLCCGEKSYNGVAIVARVPVDEVRFGFGDGEDPDFSTRVAFVRAAGVSILNTYVPQGKEIAHPDYALKKRFLDRVRAFMSREAKDGDHFAWVGDMNVAPTDIDVTHPEGKRDHVCCHSEIREKFEQVSRGLADMLRRFHPEEGTFTFFDYRVKNALDRNIGWRIDHILATPALEKRVVDCFVDKEPRSWEKPSDHAPVIADLEI
ncbi:MAG: exodeoxyribonuclease III [Synergistaceae bacterium]|nr:exodeoxyribonuclease III [Synergistaceae bacterium]